MKKLWTLSIAIFVLLAFPSLVKANSGDFSGGVAIGSSYAGVNTAPTNGLLVQGNVGIGTTSPSAYLHINNAVGTENNIEVQGFGSGYGWGIAFLPITDSEGLPLLFLNASSTEVGSVVTNSTATAYNTTSDRRLKENLAPTSRGLNALAEIPVSDFNFISDKEKHRIQGLIAQDLYKIYPEAVTANGDDGIKPLEKKVSPWEIDYGRLTPLVIKAIQDLKSMFETDHSLLLKLKTDNDELRHNFEAYKSAHP